MLLLNAALRPRDAVKTSWLYLAERRCSLLSQAIDDYDLRVPMQSSANGYRRKYQQLSTTAPAAFGG